MESFFFFFRFNFFFTLLLVQWFLFREIYVELIGMHMAINEK